MRLLLLMACFCSLIACQETSTSSKGETKEVLWDTIPLQYATNFTIQKQGKNTLLSIGKAWKNATPTFQYLLYPKDSTPPKAHPEATRIAVPVARVLCSGSVDVTFLNALDATANIVGLSNGQYIYDSTIQARLANGELVNIGQDQGIDYEKAITSNPDLAFVYSIGDQNSYKKYQSIGIPAVMLSDFMETTPLGRAEWLLFVSYFLGKEAAAQAYLAKVNKAYEAIKNEAKKVVDKPTVLLGAVYKGIWYVAGGQSLMAAFIRDAGGDYLWKENREVSGVPFDFEVVYAKALEADIWINQSHYQQLPNLLRAEPMYADFKAVKEGRLYNYYKRASKNGGTDIFESAIVRPDLVLKDLLHVFHQHTVEADSLFYYMPLSSH
ncbi:MAG: ABC transporter substrate-binding protein [Aureispira sp.]